MGEFGLRNKRELWRVQMALSKIRQVRAALGSSALLPSTWVLLLPLHSTNITFRRCGAWCG